MVVLLRVNVHVYYRLIKLIHLIVTVIRLMRLRRLLRMRRTRHPFGLVADCAIRRPLIAMNKTVREISISRSSCQRRAVRIYVQIVYASPR